MATVDVKIEDYPSNNGKTESRAEPPKVEKIIKGEVLTRKPTLGSRIKKIFLGENAADIKDYAIRDVLIPTIQNAILDIVYDSLQMRFFGTTSRNRNRTGYSYTAYERAYQKPNQRDRPSYSKPRRAFDEVILASSYEAEDVLSHMCELVDVYGMASIADLNSFIGRPSGNKVDNNWGWRELGSAKVKRIPEGYLIDFPSVVNLND